MQPTSLAERVLWKKLKDKTLFGVRFLRRRSVRSIACSFYCPVAKLIVRIHHDAQPSDAPPPQHNLLRIDPFEIYRNRDAVLNLIAQHIKTTR